MQPLTATVAVPFVDLKAQYDSIKREIDESIAAVVNDTAFVGGRYVIAFEKAFAAYCGVRECVGVANGTDALFIALRALGIGPGDEVITAANSFIATSEAISMSGAQVVFVDIDPRTFNIDASLVERNIGPRTKAIIPVHLYGRPADIAAIRTLATRYNLRVIGDAAQAHGAAYRGQPLAQLADITCYSFYPGKNLGAYGDAGALVTDNPEWAAAARTFANHGRTSKYDHGLEGINSRLDGLQAAILNVKLSHLEGWTEARRRNASGYNAALAGSGVITPIESDDVRTVYHLYVIRVPDNRRDRLQEHLQNHGVSSGIHYPIALPLLNAYRRLGHSPSDFPQSFAASCEILSLPMFAELTGEQIDYIAGVVKVFNG